MDIRAVMLLLVGVIFCAATAAEVISPPTTSERLATLQRKLEYLDLKYDEGNVLLQSLMEERLNLASTVQQAEEQNRVLKDMVNKLRPTTQNHAEQLAVRFRRQSNSTNEGPVAFMSSLSNDCKHNIMSKQDLAFRTVTTNLGNAYNSASGVFTVPRAGVYLFSSSILADQIANSEIVHVAIMVNGHIVVQMMAASEASKHRDQGANTVILDLQQGDKVWLRNVGRGGVSICGFSGFSTFSGYLLYPY